MGIENIPTMTDLAKQKIPGQEGIDLDGRPIVGESIFLDPERDLQKGTEERALRFWDANGDPITGQEQVLTRPKISDY